MPLHVPFIVEVICVFKYIGKANLSIEPSGANYLYFHCIQKYTVPHEIHILYLKTDSATLSASEITTLCDCIQNTRRRAELKGPTVVQCL